MTGHPRSARFLLLLAAAGALTGCPRGGGTAPVARDGEAPGPPWFREAARERGLVFLHASGHDGKRHLFPEIMGGGVALLDVEGDGDLDVYLVQSGTLHEPEVGPALAEAGSRLFLNDGTGHFTDATEGSGAGAGGYGMGVTAGDYDGDGDADLYVTNVGPNVLLRNEGDGTFTDVTAVAGVGDEGWGTSAGFLDYDGDGDRDLFVCNYVAWSKDRDLVCYNRSGRPDYCSPQSYDAPQPDVLYENLGDGTFADVSLDAGLRAAFGTGLGVLCADFDGDRLPDIFVANDGMANQLWRNRGDGTFEDVALERGCGVDRNGKVKAGMGALAGDVDDDGDLDLLVVNLQAQADSFFRNEGAWFRDDTPRVGLGAVSRPYTRFGVGWFDFDNDGHLDLYQANGRVTLPDAGVAVGDDPFAEENILLRGTEAGRFERVRPTGGVAEPLAATSRGAAFGDLDGNGGVDVVVVNRDGPAHLLLNVAPERGHWIRFRVTDAAGADADGAIVTLRLGERTLRRDVRIAAGYCTANAPRAHFGLGAHETVTDVTIRWPNGTERAFASFAIDQEHVVGPTSPGG